MQKLIDYLYVHHFSDGSVVLRICLTQLLYLRFQVITLGSDVVLCLDELSLPPLSGLDELGVIWVKQPFQLLWNFVDFRHLRQTRITLWLDYFLSLWDPLLDRSTVFSDLRHSSIELKLYVVKHSAVVPLAIWLRKVCSVLQVRLQLWDRCTGLRNTRNWAV